MELADRFVTSSSPEDVWSLFWDLPRVAMCLPGCEKIESTDATHLQACMVQKVGPFQISMDVDITVDEISKGQRVVVSGTGKDRMGNRLKLSTLLLELASGTDGTNVSYFIDFTLYGRLATLGNSVIKRKAEEMRVEFTRRILAELNTTAQ